MAFDKMVSELRDTLLDTLVNCDTIFDNIAKDRYQFFAWELKFLHIFLGPQSLAFADECGIVDVTQKMQNIWKRLYDILKTSNVAEEDYVEEFFVLYPRDEFIDPKTDPFPFHIPTEIWNTKMEFRAKYTFSEISIPLDPANSGGGVATSKLVLEFVDAAVWILRDIVEVDARWSLFYLPGLKEQIEEVLEELNLLKFFVSFVSNKCIEPQIRHTFFTHVLSVASHAVMVVWLYLPSQYDRENQQAAPCHEMNALLFDLLQMKIKPIQPAIRKIYIDVLQALKSTIQPGWHPNIQNTPAADGDFVETLAQNLVEPPAVGNSQEMLSLLRANLIHLPVLDLDFHLQDMDTVIVDAGLLIYSLYDSEWEKEGVMLEDVNRVLGLNLPSNTQPIKVMIYLIIRKAFQSNLPRIHGLGYVDFLLNNLKEFERRNPDSLASITYQLQMTQKELESLQPFLKAVAEERHNELNNIPLCATQLIGKAYEVEYIVDACIRKEAPVWCLERWLLDILKEITLIKDKVAMIHEMKMVGDAMNTVTAHTSSNLARSPRMNEEIVGFKDVIEKLRNQLIRGTKGRDVISIVGMPGLGKTTLAYRLYYDRSVVSHFDIRAQCCVSQVYSRKDLLVAILRDAIGKSFKLTKDCANELADDAIGENSKRTAKSAHELADDATDENSKRTEKSADELADELRKTIFQRRYLILVDDVWENSVWDDLRGCFHDANNGSRIILTTRNKEVADYARFQSDPLHLRMFNDDESLKLLSLKVFGRETSSPLLADVGRKIAKQCGQLPLSLSLVGGILAQKEKKEEWEEVAKDLGQYIHSDSKAVIEQSYQNLPYHLRSCFLYFAAFSEDSLITVSKLTTLWISEGLIKGCEGKSTEDTAKGYLENLIGRNLVNVAKTSSDGEVKACRIHDLLHDFTKERAEEENFLQRIERDQNSYSSVRSHKQHARSVHIHEEEGFKECSSSWSLVGSVIFHRSSSSVCTVSHILYNFKFLKVLDLGTANVDSFPIELVYLRYISASTSLQSIPSSIANNWNLESLMIKNRKDHMSLPITIWKLVKLRHLVGSSFSVGKELLQNSSALNDLRTLYTPQFDCVKDANLMLTETPNLRKLRCIFENLEDSQYHVLYCPTQLETLKILPPKFSFLPYGSLYLRISAPNIQNLSLSHFILDLQHLSDIAQLENLQVLKLKNIGFPGEWEVSDEGFPKLKVLKVVGCRSLQKWTADDAFPELERLFLRRCKYLQGIPSCFEDICTLKSIEIVNCSRAVIKAARKIHKIQVEDMQRPCELSISY